MRQIDMADKPLVFTIAIEHDFVRALVDARYFLHDLKSSVGGAIVRKHNFQVGVILRKRGFAGLANVQLLVVGKKKKRDFEGHYKSVTS